MNDTTPSNSAYLGYENPKPLIENQQHTKYNARVRSASSRNVERGPGKNSSASEGTIRFYAK
jgi:hypothetical protein